MKFKVSRALINMVLFVTLIIVGLSLCCVAYGTNYGYLFATDTLNLTVEGRKDNYVNIDVMNMSPGKQIRGYYTIKNKGTMEGYLNICNIRVKDYENQSTSLETSSGDKTESVGELSSLVNVRIFTDVDRDGWVDQEDTVLYNGKTDKLSGDLKINKKVAAGSEVRIGVIFDWQEADNFNKALGDTMQFAFRTDLSQKGI